MYVHRPLLSKRYSPVLSFLRCLLLHVASTATAHQRLQLAGVLSTDGHARGTFVIVATVVSAPHPDSRTPSATTVRHFKSNNKRNKERQIDISDISKNSGGWVGKTGKDWRHLKTVGAGGWPRPTENHKEED
ncbi:hypothetical protein BKA93DRAFT_496013 [Sparassis latifolia]